MLRLDKDKIRVGLNSSWQRPKLSLAVREVELMKREERNTWSRIYFMCIWIYIYMCTNAFINK